MVCARGLMRANPIDNSIHIAPGDDGVHQPVAAAARQVLITETEPPQIIHIVGQREISGSMRSRDLSRFGRIGFKYDGLLDRQKSIRCLRSAGARSVFRRDEIRMRAVGSLCG